MRLAVRAVRAPLWGSRAGGALCRTTAAIIRAGAGQRSPLAPRATWGIQSSPFSMTSFTRDEATATLLKEEDTMEEEEEEAAILENGQPEGGKKIPERDATFASLKPHISYPTWKALTVKPFGYKEMSNVQERVLHLLPDLAAPPDQPMSDGQGGRDLLVKARTGTGKTIAFLVPAVEKRVNAIYNVERGRFTKPFQQRIKEMRPDFNFESLDKHGRQALAREFATNTVGTLILSPTRELATQIANEAVKLHYNHERFGVQLLVGGQSRANQLRDWRRSRPDIVVATPGRMKDLMTSDPMIRDAVKMTQTLVLDEADTLLEMGFRGEIEEILKGLPQGSDRNTMLFSATVSRDIREIARKSLQQDYRYMDCVPAGEDNVHNHIPQSVTVLDSAADQLAHLLRLIALDQLQNPGKSKIIIFGNTTKYVQYLSQILGSREIMNCFPLHTTKYEIHAQKDQVSRFNTSDRFRRDTSGASILITTDVSARGVDYPGTTRVIQIGAPSGVDQYIHRIGRTGRAGAQGNADIILLPMEASFLHSGLNTLPVKQRSVQEVKDELETIASKFDDDPTSVIDANVLRELSNPPSSGSRRVAQRFDTQRGLIQKPLLERAIKVPETAQNVAQAQDQETVSLVFMSFVGFYIGNSSAFRNSKTELVEGLKKWAVEAGGLENEPFLSRSMTERLGLERDGQYKENPRNQRGGRGGFSRFDGGGRGGRGGFSRFDGGDRGGRGGFSRFDGGDRGGRGGFSRFDGGDRGGSRFGGFRGDSDRQGGDREGGGYAGGRYNDTRSSDDAGGEREGFSGGGYRGGFSRGGRGGFSRGGSRGGSSFRDRSSYGDQRDGSRFGNRDGDGGSRFGSRDEDGGSRFGSRDGNSSGFDGGYRGRGGSRGGFRSRPEVEFSSSSD